MKEEAKICFKHKVNKKFEEMKVDVLYKQEYVKKSAQTLFAIYTNL